MSNLLSIDLALNIALIEATALLANLPCLQCVPDVLVGIVVLALFAIMANLLMVAYVRNKTYKMAMVIALGIRVLQGLWTIGVFAQRSLSCHTTVFYVYGGILIGIWTLEAIFTGYIAVYSLNIMAKRLSDLLTVFGMDCLLLNVISTLIMGAVIYSTGCNDLDVGAGLCMAAAGFSLLGQIYYQRRSGGGSRGSYKMQKRMTMFIALVSNMLTGAAVLFIVVVRTMDDDWSIEAILAVIFLFNFVVTTRYSVKFMPSAKWSSI
jgi:uncharacterized membrane protein YfbV (UPF0208 family)